MELVAIGFAFAAIIVAAAVALPLIAASFIGVLIRGPDRAPLLYGAMQGACYLSGWMFPLVFMCWVTISGTIAIITLFDINHSDQVLGISADIIVPVLNFGVLFLGIIAYLVLPLAHNLRSALCQ
jgi:hypothetical protein